MKRIKICEYCKKEFESNQKAKFCSLNCRVKAHYHKTHQNAKYIDKTKTAEEKRLEYNKYSNQYYYAHKEKILARKRERYHEKKGAI